MKNDTYLNGCTNMSPLQGLDYAEAGIYKSAMPSGLFYSIGYFCHRIIFADPMKPRGWHFRGKEDNQVAVPSDCCLLND